MPWDTPALSGLKQEYHHLQAFVPVTLSPCLVLQLNPLPLQTRQQAKLEGGQPAPITSLVLAGEAMNIPWPLPSRFCDSSALWNLVLHTTSRGAWENSNPLSSGMHPPAGRWGKYSQMSSSCGRPWPLTPGLYPSVFLVSCPDTTCSLGHRII